MDFADMHIHALYGVDDGADTKEKMLSMVEASYNDGVRLMCFTPHFHLGYFGDNREASEKAFAEAREAAAEKFPELKLLIGNELRYEPGGESWLCDGLCRTMNGTKYVLVDFYTEQDAKTIHKGIEVLLNSGYTPILAHAERYSRLKLDDGYKLKENGVLLQMDTQSLLGVFGFFTKKRCKALLKEKIIDMVGSDAHGMVKRPPGISECYSALSKICEKEYAEYICCKAAQHILTEEDNT